MEERQKIVPPTIYCPKCGKQVKVTEETNPLTLKILNTKGYIAKGDGKCNCGVTLTIIIKQFPRSPSYTIMFDVYKVGGESHA